MAAKFERYAPAVLEADPVYLAYFCARAEALSLILFRPACLVLTYGRASRLQLARIKRAFPIPIVSSYGSTETGYVFISCERGRFHQNVASCRVYILPVDVAQRVGRLAVTPFAHPGMCLLRYEVGDLVRIADHPCPCGRDRGFTLEDHTGARRGCVAGDGRSYRHGRRARRRSGGRSGYLLHRELPNRPAATWRVTAADAVRRPLPRDDGRGKPGGPFWGSGLHRAGCGTGAAPLGQISVSSARSDGAVGQRGRKLTSKRSATCAAIGLGNEPQSFLRDRSAADGAFAIESPFHSLERRLDPRESVPLRFGQSVEHRRGGLESSRVFPVRLPFREQLLLISQCPLTAPEEGSPASQKGAAIWF